MHTTRTRRVLAAAASTAVAAAGFAAFTPTAQAAEAGALSFTCDINAFGMTVLAGEKFSLESTLTLPAKATQNKAFAVGMTGTVSASETTRSTAAALGTLSVSGTATVNVKLGSSAQTFAANVGDTPVPGSGEVLALPVAGSGSWKTSAVGSQSVTVLGFSAPLKLNKADGVIDATAECVADAPATVVGSVVVEKAAAPAPKAASKTTAKVKVAKSKKATATITVKAGKKAATGKVSLKLKKGKKVIGTKTVSLKKGKAKFTFSKKLAKGKYSLTASYKGNKSTKTSKKVVSFKVK